MIAIIFTCGGTGGHVYPAISLAQELSGDFAVHFLGTSDREDHRIVASYGFDFIPVGTRSWGILNLARSFWTSFRTLWRLRPVRVVSTGGGQTAMVVMAAFLLRIPVILLEQNAIPGRTNKLLSRLASQVVVAFPTPEGSFPEAKTRCLGNPVRKTYLQDPWFAEFSAQVPQDLPMILVFGGSQGARALNQWVESHYPDFIAAGYGVIHLTGSRQGQSTAWETRLEGKVFRLAYAEAMDWLYERASIVISRAGATSIAELIAFQKKAILVPFPFAKDNHQQANGRYFADRYPGVVIDEDDLSWETVGDAMAYLKPKVFPTQTVSARESISEMIREGVSHA